MRITRVFAEVWRRHPYGGQLGCQRLEVGGLPHDPHRDKPGAGRLERVLDRGGDVARQVTEREDPDPASGQLVPDEHRVDPLAELVRVAELGGELVGLLAYVSEVACQALLEVAAGAGDDVVAELGPDQDPDREREEDRRERCDVVARAVAHKGGRVDRR